MKYRIMKIGNKYAAQSILSSGAPGDYIQRDSQECWSHPKYVIEKCTHDTIEDAKAAGDIYIKPYNEMLAAQEIIDEAIEVKW